MYFTLMGMCVALFVPAWGMARLWSPATAAGLCALAMVIQPVAAVIANRRGPDDLSWDSPSGDPESARWWDEPDDTPCHQRTP